jgi:hypothetical protein
MVSASVHRISENATGGTGMVSSYTSLVLLISAALLAPPAFAANVHRLHASGQTGASHKLTPRSKHRSHRVRGQQAIDPERVTQIQQALIREHYLNGEASGRWDATTVTAMQKYQADHGWQTKLMPDSRALKNLGLGPDYSGAINAKAANFTAPSASGDAPTTQTAGFTAASGVNQ